MSELTNCGEYAYHLFKPNEVSSGTYVLQIFVKNCTKCDFIGSLENLIDRDKNINKSSAEITEEFIKSLDYQRPEEKRFTEMVNSDNPFVRVYFSLGRSKVVVANTVEPPANSSLAKRWLSIFVLSTDKTYESILDAYDTLIKPVLNEHGLDLFTLDLDLDKKRDIFNEPY